MFWACQRTTCAHFHENPSRIKNHLVESEKSFSAEKRKTIEITTLTTDTGKAMQTFHWKLLFETVQPS